MRKRELKSDDIIQVIWVSSIPATAQILLHQAAQVAWLLMLQDCKFLGHYDICLKTGHALPNQSYQWKFIFTARHWFSTAHEKTIPLQIIFDHYKDVCNGQKYFVMACLFNFCNGRDKETHTKIDFWPFGPLHVAHGRPVIDGFFSARSTLMMMHNRVQISPLGTHNLIRQVWFQQHAAKLCQHANNMAGCAQTRQPAQKSCTVIH